MKKIVLLDCLAKLYRTSIPNLRLLPDIKWTALGDLYRMKSKENYSLKEWNEAVSYLLGCEVNFKDYGEIEKSLKAIPHRKVGAILPEVI